MDSVNIEQLLAVVTIVIGLSAGYARAFGPYQAAITQAIIDAFRVPRHYRRLTNIGVGLTLAVAFTLVGAAAIGNWAIIPAGILAGLLASVEANKAHDEEADKQSSKEVAERASRFLRE